MRIGAELLTSTGETAMKESYYVNDNAQSNGDHEVHKSGRSFMPRPENRTYLGMFENCADR